MKGKNHLLSGVLLLCLLFAFDLFFGLVVYDFLSNLNVVVVFTLLYLFFAGVLLPDADKFGSWVFKFALPLALSSWLLGFVFSFLKGKRFRHRGFLHSFAGVVSSSFVSSVVIYFIFLFFLELDFFVLILFFTALVVGQFLHLLFD